MMCVAFTRTCTSVFTVTMNIATELKTTCIMNLGKTILMILVLCTLPGMADYACVCNYNKYTNVYPQPDTATKPIGYLYEFDCKLPYIHVPTILDWKAIQFEKKVGYIQVNKSIVLQTCPGNPSIVDLGNKGNHEVLVGFEIGQIQPFITELPALGHMKVPTHPTTPSVSPSTLVHLRQSTTDLTTSINTFEQSTVHRSSDTYPCVCDFNELTSVHPQPDNATKPIGYLNGFICKPFYKPTISQWMAIQFEKKVGYIQVNEYIKLQICPGILPSGDLVPTSPTTSTGSPSTRVQTGHTTTGLTASIDIGTTGVSKFTTDEHSTIKPTFQAETTVLNEQSPQNTDSTNGKHSTVKPTFQAETTVLNEQSTKYNETTNAQQSRTLSTITPYEVTTENSQTLQLKSTKYSEQSTMFNATVGQSNATPSFDIYTSAKQSFFSVGTSSSGKEPAALTTELPVTSVQGKNATSITSTTGMLNSSRKPSFIVSTIETTSTQEVTTEETTNEPVASVSVITATTIAVPTFGPAGKRYLCPFMVKHDTEMQYLAQHGNYCYELYPYLSKDWFTAETYCRFHNGSLAVISSREIQDVVEYLLDSTRFYHSVWIGLHDLRTEGQWEWTDGTLFTSGSFENWRPYHHDPVYAEEQDCVLLDGRTGKWKDVVCDGFLLDIQRHPWVCQYYIPRLP